MGLYKGARRVRLQATASKRGDFGSRVAFKGNVRFGSKADIPCCSAGVPLWGITGHLGALQKSLL